MTTRLWFLVAGSALALALPSLVDRAAAQDLAPEDLRQINQQRKLIEKDQIELEGRFESMEAAQRGGNCATFEIWRDLINTFLDNQIGQYGPPTGLPSRRNVFQAAETRLARIYERGCPLPVDEPAIAQSSAPQVFPGSNQTPTEIITGDHIVAEREREPDERAAIKVMEALRQRGECAAYRAEWERLRGLLEVVSLPPLLPCPPSQAPQPPSPEADDLDAIVDDPNASLGPQGLAPDEARRSDIPIDVPGGFGYQAAPRLYGYAPGALPSVGLFGSFGEIDIPLTGIGFVREGPPGDAPERFAATTPRRINFVEVEGFFQFLAGRTPIRLAASYGEGDAVTVFDIADGTFDGTGIVNGAPAPSGSAGLATPGFALSGGTRVDARRVAVRAEAGIVNVPSFNIRDIDVPVGRGITGPAVPSRTAFALSIFGEYSHSKRGYESTAGFSQQFPGVLFEANQVRQQQVTDQVVTAGLRGRLAVLLANSVIAHLEAEAGGAYIDSELASRERVTANVGPPEDRDYVIEIFDSDDGFGFHGGAGAALEFRLSPRASLVARGSVDYRSRVGGMFNPSSGDQVSLEGRRTGLRSDDSFSWEVGAGLVLRLGAD